ncbi:FecR domain-containing protein [Cryomorphaceae bacterium 1068]|nr:FecR domain-containing protein [Cryomorphaceae bacterium 1068]
MNDLEKAEDRLKAYKAPFSDESVLSARAKVMARTIHFEEEVEHSQGFNFGRFYAAAAGLALILSIPFAIHFIGTTTLTATEISSEFTLPDGSKMMLAEGSSISYNSLLWNLSRRTDLEGEGYFTVKSGDEFTVETEFGDVTVLGTRFSVWENEDALVVQCQEGKVDVEGEILEADDYIIMSLKNSTQGKWTNNEPFISQTANDLSFDNAPIHIVIESLEEKFGKDIQFKTNAVYRFSGSLNESDLDSSLKILTKPFGLEISSNEGGVVILEP